MTSTIKMIQNIKSIASSIEIVLNKDAQLDADFASVNAEIASRYQAKITQLESTRNRHISNITAQIQSKKASLQVQANNVKASIRTEFGKASAQAQTQQMQFQNAIARLVQIENGIPQRIKKKYRKTTAAIVPKNPDFQALSEISTRINDASLPGHAKRVFHYGGYSSMSEMVNTLMDEIESGRMFINAENQKTSLYLAQVKSKIDNEIMNAEREMQRLNIEADNELQNQISIANHAFQRDKIELDRKKTSFIQQNEQQYNIAAADLRTEFEKLLNSPELHRFDEQLLSLLGKLGAFEDEWNGYSPSESYPAEVMLGAIDILFEMPSPVCDMLKEKMPIAYATGQSITLPMTASLNKPLNMQVQYDSQQKDIVMVGIQSIILKFIRFMPTFSFSLTYIDPNDRGTNLGRLQKLSSITASDICKKVYTSKEDIAKRLKDLEAFVDQTSSELAGIDNIYIYNASHETKIPYHLIVVNDYPDNFERNSMESLKVLINNSRKCGISFIFTSQGSLSDQIASDLIVHARNNGAVVTMDGRSYDFIFDGVIPTCETFIEAVKTVYNEGLKVDNRYSTFFKLNKISAYIESTHVMSIPFAVDSTKRLISLELGGAQSAHALLSGRTGSGKSTTLHMLISSIVLNYHPNDVELWLVDYKKVEFAEYIKNMPPHIKLLGLERSAEFTYSLLGKLDGEFQRRLELFKNKGVNTITEYKERYGVRSLPRIIFIVDEFHQMTQAIKNEPHYVQVLENILSEYRVFGLSCVFSDQAISDGLRGLTEKGRKQISIRLAMENDMSEVRETLALDNSLYDDSLKNKIMRMSKGDVVFKRFTDEGEIILDKYKTVFITRDERIDVINHSVQLSGSFNEKDTLIVDGQKRGKYEESVISAFERSQQIDTSRLIPLYVGTAVNLDPCFSFSLRKKTDSNVMVIGSDDELRTSILFHIIYSFKKAQGTGVIIFADKNDEIYRQYKNHLSELLGDNDDIFTNLSDICEEIENTLTKLNADNEQRILMCWLGLEEIADEFSVQQEKRMNSRNNMTPAMSATSAVDSLISDMDALLNAFDDETPSPQAAPTQEVRESSVYDARPDVQELFAKGSRYNLFSFVTFSSVKMIRQTKFIKTENFEHKIALSMSMDDSATYLGRGAYASGLDALSAVYEEGSGIVRTFRPYLF